MEMYPNECFEAVRFPAKGSFSFQAPTNWAGDEQDGPPCKWDVRILIVANDAGLRQYFDWHRLRQSLNEAGVTAQWPYKFGEQWWIQAQETGPPARVHAHKRFKSAEVDTNLPYTPPCLSAYHDVRVLPHYALTEGPDRHIYEGYVAAYTDGSADAGCIGGAVYQPDTASVYMVDPSAYGNNIFEAEATAIYAHLCLVADRYQDSVLYTDSRACLDAIHNAMRSPMHHVEHEHQILLQRIVDVLLLRGAIGARTALVKIKAHAGHLGNEVADSAAKHMCHYNISKRAHPEQHVNTPACIEVGEHPGRRHANGFWVAKPEPVPTVERNNEGGANPAPQAQHEQAAPGRVVMKPVANLMSALHKPIRMATRLGNANTDGVYFSSWAKTTPDVERHVLEHMWHRPKGIRDAHIRTVMRYRGGVLYNNKLAFRYKQSTTSKCPLCNKEDSATHMLLQCTHRKVKAMVIKRHNQAVQAIAKAIANGRRGGSFLIMDAGKLEDVQESVSSTIQGTRLPEWMVPDLPTNMRNRLRPDILIIPGMSCRHHAPDSNSTREFYGELILLEVGFCNDTMFKEKLAEKADQHRRLQDHLRKAGWLCINIVPIALGVSGSVYKQMTQQLTEVTELLTKAECDKLSLKLNRLAITWMHNLVCARRQLQHQKPTKTHGRASVEVT